MSNYFLIGAGMTLSSSWLTQAKAAPWSVAGMKQAWIIGLGAILFAVIAWKGSAMAAQLLGGGPNLSHNEVFHGIGAAAQAGFTAALAAAGLASAGAGVIGAGAAAGGGAGATADGGAKGASPSGGGSTPASKPPSSGSGAKSGPSPYQTAGAAISAIHSAGGGGSHQVHPPQFGGFNGHGHE